MLQSVFQMICGNECPQYYGSKLSILQHIQCNMRIDWREGFASDPQDYKSELIQQILLFPFRLDLHSMHF